VGGRRRCVRMVRACWVPVSWVVVSDRSLPLDRRRTETAPSSPYCMSALHNVHMPERTKKFSC